MENHMTLHDYLNTISDNLETRKRNNGEEFTCIKDGAPDWIQAAIEAAHGDGTGLMFPDDQRYEMVEGVCRVLAGYDDPEDSDNVFEALDGLVPIYNHELTAWLGSRADRAGYVDDACEEYGMETSDTMQRIGIGYLAELQEVHAGLVSHFESEHAE